VILFKIIYFSMAIINFVLKYTKGFVDQ